VLQHKKNPLAHWESIVQKHYPAGTATRLIYSLRQNYADLLAGQPLPDQPKLRWHAVEHIFPGLALYRAILREHGGDGEAALVEVDLIFRLWMVERKRLQGLLLKVVPLPFSLFRQIARWTMRVYPAEGWDFEPVEDSPERVAFNATRCFYLNTLTACGAPELTASFCKLDDIHAETFPANVRFIRPHTLGRGDTLCDFQYCRVAANRKGENS
jgi:hypothetical protein